MTAPTVSPLALVPCPPGSPSTNGSSSAQVEWPVLQSAALYGLAGKVVRTLEPETEADPPAMLVSFLSAFGCAVGPDPHCRVGAAKHPARLYVVIAGKSSKARKGTSWTEPREVFRHADGRWVSERVKNGLSSGEGLIQAIRDAGPGGLLVYEPEFAHVLTVAGRDGNTLSTVIRQAWDTGNFSVMTKVPLAATGGHVSLLTQITVEELHQKLTTVQAANGFANRFLFCCAKRGALLPSGGRSDDEILAPLGKEVANALVDARSRGALYRSTAAEAQWEEMYREIARDDPAGLLGGVVSRGDTQVLRLSLIYALLDCSPRIEPVHLDAAGAVWSYCRQSAAWLFGGRSGDPGADRIIAILTAMPNRSATRRELQEACARHLYGARLDRALERLEERGVIVRMSVPTGGRPAQTIVLVEPDRL